MNFLANRMGLKNMEWTLDYKNLTKTLFLKVKVKRLNTCREIFNKYYYFDGRLLHAKTVWKTKIKNI